MKEEHLLILVAYFEGLGHNTEVAYRCANTVYKMVSSWVAE